jgi:hypothetical protein
MQRRSKTCFDQRVAELHGESFAFFRQHILTREKNREAVKVVTILLLFVADRPFLQKAVFYRVVVNRDKEIGIALVRHLRAFNEANIAAAGIN